MVKREKANYMIQSVTHAIEVLEELAKAAGEVGVTELSKRLKLHKNNVFRLLATLELRGYVEQNGQTEDYRLGVKALQLGQAYLMQSTVVAKAQPLLRALSEEIGETISLAVLQNGQVQFPVTIESKRPVKVAPRVGVSFQAKQSAAGRLLTALLSDAILSEILVGNSPQDAAIKNQLSELRTSGQIIDRGGIEADVISISVIVRGYNGAIVGAIEVLAPQYRAKIEEILPLVKATAEKLSVALGNYQPAGLAAALEKEIMAGTTTATGTAATAKTSEQPARMSRQ